MAAVGAVAKGHKNPQQGYQYRAVDDVMAALQSILAEHEVFVYPRVTESRSEQVLIGVKKTPMIHVISTIEYHFCASDGSQIIAATIGEATDSADKAGNKAMASAFKYALTQTFCIPTADAKDSERDHPELSPGAVMDHNGEQAPDEVF